MDNDLIKVGVIDGELKTLEDTSSQTEKSDLTSKSQEKNAQTILDAIADKSSTDGYFVFDKYGLGLVSKGIEQQKGMTGEEILSNLTRQHGNALEDEQAYHEHLAG